MPVTDLEIDVPVYVCMYVGVYVCMNVTEEIYTVRVSVIHLLYCYLFGRNGK